MYRMWAREDSNLHSFEGHSDLNAARLPIPPLARQLVLYDSIVAFARQEELACYSLIAMYFVYILECADGTLYTGCTNDLEKRLRQHNESKSGAHYTKIRRPVVLKYYEEFETLLKARGREAEIKRLPRKSKASLFL